MEPVYRNFKNIDSFINEAHSIMDSEVPSEKKVQYLSQLIEANAEFFVNYKNPAATPQMEKLAGRVQPLSQSLSDKLIHYGKGFQFPPELMPRIVQEVVQDPNLKLRDMEALKVSSKAQHKQAMRSYQGTLEDLLIHKGQPARIPSKTVLQYIQNYGEGLTHLDLTDFTIDPTDLEQILACLPKLTTLKIDADSFHLPTILQASLPELEILQIGGLEHEDLLALGQATQFPRLTRLEIESLDITPEALRQFGGSSLARQLQSLKLQIMCEDAHILALASAKGFQNLRHLDLSDHPRASSPITGNSLRMLVRSQLAKQLETVVLSNMAIRDVGVQALLSEPLFERLQTLILRSNYITEVGVKALADCRALSTLQKLDLSENPIRDRGVTLLSLSPFLANIRTLLLKSCAIEEGAASLQPFTKLEELDLSYNDLWEETMAALVPSLQNVRSLNLGQHEQSRGQLGDETVKLLSTLQNLRELTLRWNRVTNQGALLLATSEAMQQLRRLDLDDNLIDGTGALLLINRDWINLQIFKILDGIPASADRESALKAYAQKWEDKSGKRKRL